MAGWLLFSVLWQFENSMFSLHCHGFHPLLGLDGVCDMEVCLWGHASHQGPSRNFHGAVVWNRSAWCTITDKTVKLFHLEKTEVSHPPSPFPPPEELLIPKHTQALCVSVTSSGVSHLQLSHSPGFLALFLQGFHHVFSWCLSIERWLFPPHHHQLLNSFAWFLYLQVVTTKKVHTWQISQSMSKGSLEDFLCPHLPPTDYFFQYWVYLSRLLSAWNRSFPWSSESTLEAPPSLPGCQGRATRLWKPFLLRRGADWQEVCFQASQRVYLVHRWADLARCLFPQRLGR